MNYGQEINTRRNKCFITKSSRKTYEEKHGDEVISEILVENPNKFEIDEEEENEKL